MEEKQNPDLWIGTRDDGYRAVFESEEQAKEHGWGTDGQPEAVHYAPVADNNPYRAVLEGAGYRDLDKVGTYNNEQATLLGKMAKDATLNVIGQLCLLKKQNRAMQTAMQADMKLMYEQLVGFAEAAQRLQTEQIEEVAKRNGLETRDGN
jgi:hypothetical protein